MTAENTSAAPQASSRGTTRPGVDRTRARKAGDMTRERMLNAAESLFAAHGFHGTSMRDVAEKSASRIALVTYHFGTKDLLFDKVVERRASYMALERMRLLDAAKGKAGSGLIPVRDLVHGYVWPFVDRSENGGEGWKDYSHLVARMSNSPAWGGVISKHYDAVARVYITEFRRTLSDVDEEIVYQAFTFMIAAMVGMVAEPGRVETLSVGRHATADVTRAYRNLLPFLVGGFGALPTSASAGRPG